MQMGCIVRVTEPGGRYLQFTYTTVNGYQALTGSMPTMARKSD